MGKQRPWDKQGFVQGARDIGGCCTLVVGALFGITAVLVAVGHAAMGLV